MVDAGNQCHSGRHLGEETVASQVPSDPQHLPAIGRVFDHCLRIVWGAPHCHRDLLVGMRAKETHEVVLVG
jgi:hypothetical protein